MNTTVQAKQESSLEKWKASLSKAAKDPRWDAWDFEIQSSVLDYNSHLHNTPGYISLDWRLIKAMAWVETGADSSQWNSKPMQIGVTGDPGLSAFLAEEEGSESIIPPLWKGTMNAASIRSTPAYNFRAGVGYLLMRLANFQFRSVPDADNKEYEVVVDSGDNLERIARRQATTVDLLKQLNPMVSTLHVGQVLKYKKGAIKRVITSWRHISTASIAHRYNGGGDPQYAAKLDYALAMIIEKQKAQVGR
jgi:hypothetical protein